MTNLGVRHRAAGLVLPVFVPEDLLVRFSWASGLSRILAVSVECCSYGGSGERVRLRQGGLEECLLLCFQLRIQIRRQVNKLCNELQQLQNRPS